MVRISRKLDSETLHLPELKPLLGRTVEITVEEKPPQVRDEFWAEASRVPQTQEDLDSQKTIFRRWRSDDRFQPYWAMLDALTARDLAAVQKWTAIHAQLPLDEYDYEAIADQNKRDVEDAQRRFS